MSSFISALSCIFQKDVDLSLIQPFLKTTINSIKEIYIIIHSPGPNLSKTDRVLVTDLKRFQIVATDTQKKLSRVYIQATSIV